MPTWIASPAADDPDPWKGGFAEAQFASLWQGELAVLDAWGQPIRAVHPGRLPNVSLGDDPANVDEDGTIFLSKTGYNGYAAEHIYGVCQSRQICFVSAGPDGKWGIVGPEFSGSDDLVNEAADNVYSYPLGQP